MQAIAALFDDLQAIELGVEAAHAFIRADSAVLEQA
jgi:hypothetical protein